MNRARRRLLSVALGLSLGWIAAGWWATALPVWALGDDQADHPTHALDAGHALPEHDSDHGGDASAAENLVPRDAHGVAAVPTWFGPVTFAAGALFVAAVVLGIPALKLRGPLPPELPEPVDDHAHHGEGHGHAPTAH